MLLIGNLAIQLTTPLLLRKPCKLFASVARVCQRQLGFLVCNYYSADSQLPITDYRLLENPRTLKSCGPWVLLFILLLFILLLLFIFFLFFFLLNFFNALGSKGSRGLKIKFKIQKLEKLEVRLAVGKIKGFLYQN